MYGFSLPEDERRILRRHQDARPYLRFRVAVADGSLGRMEAALQDCEPGCGVDLAFAEGLQDLLARDLGPLVVQPILAWGMEHVDADFLRAALLISGGWRDYAWPLTPE